MCAAGYARPRPRKLIRRKHEWDEEVFEPIDWKKEHSFTDVRLFMELGGRSTGKTFGLRLENIEEYWKYGRRFCEIVRNKTELAPFQQGYFEKIDRQREFPELMYKVEANRAYIAKVPKEDEDPQWELAGYFVALSSEQDTKKMSFDGVMNFTYDEAVIDRVNNPRKKYLPDEYSSIMGVMNTVLREVPGEPKRARLHLLGNTCDLTCGLFRSIGVKKVPRMGRTFYGKDRRAMIMRRPNKYADNFREQTTVGQLMGLSEDAARDSGVFFDNEFAGEFSPEVAPKPSRARHMYTIVFGEVFGIWYDLKAGLVYVSSKAPDDGRPVFAMLRRDATIDYTIIRRSSEVIKTLASMERSKLIRYESPVLAAHFGEFLTYIGVR